MAKALRTAAIVIGAAALIVATAGAAAPAATAGALSAIGITASAATVATLASATAAALSVAATVATPKGTVGGNATKFKIDKDAGIPIVFGRTYVGGNVIHRQYYDDPRSRMKNQRESWVTVLSLGPVKSVGPLLIDKKPVYFSGTGAAIGDFAGNMWLDTQLGACPEPRALRSPTGDFPGWNASSRLSGKAADLWTLDFDSKGKKFPTGVPQRGRVLEGRFAYDPRLDGTFPGGVGACRIDDPTTHVYTENPWLHAITFAYGYYQNGHLVAGGELPITGIDLNAFVQAANTADLNGWKCGGLVYTTADQDWDILKMLAQAGGGEVFPVGGLLTCMHAAPRVSIGTITTDDIIGDVIAPSTASIRVRRNTIIPRVRLEAQGWEVVPITAVTVPEYATIDRAARPKETEYPLIQSAKQASEIAMYEMLDARELQPINLPCKLPTIGYRPGDCVTLNIPEANLVNRLVVLRERELDMGTFGVTFVARSEDPAKHPFALGTSSTPPPTPDLTVPGLDLDPPVGWAAVATMIPSPGVPLPAIVVSGLVDNGGAEGVQFDYRPNGTPDWLSAGTFGVDVTRVEITSVVAEATYDVSVRYRVRGQLGDRLILGPVTIPSQTIEGLKGENAPLVRTQWSIDGVSNWHDAYFGADRYYRQSNDGGVTWGPAILGVGEDGARGVDGGYEDSLFRYSSTVPATPAGVAPAEWYDAPAVTQVAGRVSTGRDDYISGDQWLRVQPGEVYRIIGGLNAAQANAAGALGLNFASNPADGTTYGWNAAGSVPAGQAGAIDGYIVVPPYAMYMRPWAQIDAVEAFGQIDYHYRIDTLPPLFMSRAKRNADNSLVGTWSAPVRISGEDGKEVMSAFLTNENFTHPTDALGAPTEITTGVGDGQMKVFLGSRDITSLCSFTVQQPYWLGVTVDAAGKYSSNYLGNDTGYAFIIAAFQGRAIAKQLNGSRTKNGTTIAIQASAQAIVTLDDALVANAPVSFAATRSNTATTAIEWRVFDGAGTPHRYFNDANGSGYFTDMADLLAIINYPYYAQGKANTRFCTVRADCAGATDTVTVIAIERGRNGKDGVHGLPGVKGADGTTYYPYVAFANSADGSIDFTLGEPGNRSFIGHGSGTAAAEPDSPIYYAWTPYRGPAFGLTGYQVSIAGSQIIMTVSGGWGTSGAYSAVGYRSGAATSFRAGDDHRAGGANIMAGLNTDPTTDNTFASIDYAWFMSDAGDAQIYENGNPVGGIISGFGTGTFQVVYDNKVVRYLYNGHVYREVAAPADLVLFFDAALAGNPGSSRLQDVTFTAGGRAGDNGAPGSPGVSPIVLDIAATAIVIAATYANVTKPGQLPRNIGVTLRQGTSDAVGAYTFGVTTSEKVTASYANGVLSITRADGEGWAEIAAYNGSTLVAGPKRVSVGRTQDPPPPQTATSLTLTGYNGDPQNTSYLAQPSGRIATVQVPASGALPYEAYINYSVVENMSFAFRTYAAAIKIVYRVAGSGSAWSDLKAESIGSAATWYRSTSEYEFGEANYTGTANLTPGESYDFALMVRKHSGNSQAQGVEGFLQVGA